MSSKISSFVAVVVVVAVGLFVLRDDGLLRNHKLTQRIDRVFVRYHLTIQGCYVSLFI